MLWNVNRKSQAADRSVSISVTLSDPDFKVTSNISKTVSLRDKVTNDDYSLSDVLLPTVSNVVIWVCL